MKHIEEFIRKKAPSHAFVGLMAAQGVKDFYTRFNYLERSKEAPGMYKLIKNNIK